MTRHLQLGRTPLFIAISLLALSSAPCHAAGRDGHDYVIDAERGPPRTGLLKQCIRTGMRDAGARAEDCNGRKPAAQAAPPSPPAAPPRAVAAPPAPPPAAAAAAEPAPSEPARRYEEEKLPPRDDGIVRSWVNPNFEAEQAAAEAAMAAKPIVKSVPRVTLDAETSFDFGRAVLRPAGRAKLDQFVAELRPLQYGTVRVVGHTDRLGDRDANRQLSLRRAQAVKDYLVGQRIDPHLIQVDGVGPDQPLTRPEDCQGLKQQALIKCLQPDRRVEIEVEAVRMMRQ